MRKPQESGVHGLQTPVIGLHGAGGGGKLWRSSEAQPGIPLVAVTAFYRLRRMMGLVRGHNGGTLSRHEHEVLAWTATGRRQADIAAMLRISRRTVENHLRSARQRLGLAATAEAIRMAITNGDIEG